MASTEYSMMLRIGAQLGSEFGGAFSKAQKRLNELQGQIRAFQKTQSDISAYERTQAAAANTERKLNDLKLQYDNIQKELQETGGESSALQNKLVDKQRAIDRVTESFNREKAKLDQMEQSLREAGINTNDLKNESAELAKKQEELADEYKETAESAKKYGEDASNAFEFVGNALLAAGIEPTLKKIYSAYKECVSASMEFEATMSTVEALSGASEQEMSELNARAKELGATTKFTATESATAMTYMGMAGWDASEMLSGMSGVMNLAAASGEDLALVSDIVTDNLTAFGLTASDTAHFSDVLAAAATNSNTSVSIMGETFRNCAPQAGALGYSIEDVAVAVGLMANAGIKGSVAGTALKNIFNGMINDVHLTAEAFGEVSYSAVNADGTMKPFAETLDDLRYYFNQMTGAEQMQNAQLLVGERAMAGFVSLMNSTSDDVASLTQNIENCSGSAEKMAQIRLDNLQGQVTLMHSASDALKTTIGEALNPELKALAKLATDILTAINKFCEENPVVVKTIILLAGAIGSVVVAYTAYKKIKGVINTYKKLSAVLTAQETAAAATHTAAVGAETVATETATVAQKGLNAAMLANPIGIVIAAIGALTIAIGALSSEYKKSVEEATAEANALKSSIDEYKQTMDSLGETYDSTIGKTEIQSQTATEYIARLKELEAQGVKTTEQQKEYANIVAQLHTLIPELNLELDKQTGLLIGGASAVQSQVDAWKEKIKLQAVESLLTEKIKAQVELTYDRDQAQKAYEQATVDYEKLVSEWEDLNGESFSPALFNDDAGYYAWLTKGTLDNNLLLAYQKVTKLKPQLEEANRLLEDSREETDALSESYMEVADSVALFASSENDSVASGERVSEVAERIPAFLEERKADLEALSNAYTEARDAAAESIEKQYKLWETAETVIPKSIGEINNALQTQTSYWSDYNTDLTNLLSRADAIEGLSEMVAEFGDGSAESVNMIAGMAAASDKELADMVANWQAVREQQQLAEDSLADLQTGYSQELDEIQSDMEDAMKALDLSDVSEEAALKTMNAYLDALRSGAADAVQTASNLSDMIEAALAGNLLQFVLGSSPGTHNSRMNTQSSMSTYAEGTDYAARGWAMVGEQGPELMWMNGGEQVLPADETAALLRTGNGDGGVMNVTVSPSFYIENGNSDMETALRECESRIVDNVVDALNELGVDAKRSAYA